MTLTARAGFLVFERPGKPDEIVCTALTPVAILEDDDGANQHLLLQFLFRGRRREIALPRAGLHQGDGSAVTAMLADRGVKIGNNAKRNRMLIVNWLTEQEPDRVIRVTDRSGWYKTGAVFVLGDRVIGSADIRGTATELFAERGTLASWQDTIARPLLGQSRFMLALCASLTAPVLRMLDIQGFGLHFVGPSSIGKSTLLTMAASVWGGPQYMRTWRTTANALEGLALEHNDLPLCLDEIAEVRAQDIGAAIYMLMGGTGKARMQATVTRNRPQKRWTTLVLSSGELGLASKALEAGGRTTGGQEVRFVDVGADAGTGHGCLNTGTSATADRALIDQLLAASTRHCGTAGPEWIAYLIEHPDAVRGTLRLGHVGGRQAGRVAQKLALIAEVGEAAIAAGILPWPPGSALSAVEAVFAGWAPVDLEPVRAVETLHEWLQTNEGRVDHDGPGSQFLWTTKAGLVVGSPQWRRLWADSGIDRRVAEDTLRAQGILLRAGTHRVSGSRTVRGVLIDQAALRTAD